MKSSALSELGRRTAEPAISWLMHAALARPRLISLAAGFTDSESLPVADTKALLDEILRSPSKGRAALQYGSTPGDAVLRRLTAARLQRLDAVRGKSPAYSQKRTIITSGSQQLLYMTAEALCDTGDIVLLEDPTYFVYLGIVQSRGLRTRGVRMAGDGIDLSHLERVLNSLRSSGELRRMKLLYLVTCFQNPTGITTSFEKKVGALKLLRQFERSAGHPIYLIEDAAYRELRFAGTDERSALAARGFEDRVIYTGTYSKPFATGVRVGFGMLPGSLSQVVTHIKGNHDFGTSNLLQKLLTHALMSGRYDRNVTALQKRYARKARIMREALQEHFPPEVKWEQPEGGLYFWARLPGRMKSGVKSKLFRAALANDVLYVPGELCYADDPTRRKPDNEMRISFGGATEENIREGIKRLGKVLRKLIR